MTNVPLLILVEDELSIRTMLSEALEDGGFALHEASDGASAMKAIDDAEELSGLLTDIRLGDGPTGWDVARHARHKFPQLAVVYMTGDSAGDWMAEGVPNSVMLQKPFAMAQVTTAIATLLNVADVSPVQSGPNVE